MENQNKKEKQIWFTIVVAALGYFVDIFDLQLFNIVGRDSLGKNGLNLSPEQINHFYDSVLFNFQMGGMLIGGLVWGIMGDKLGRKSILFGSILIYSLANIANGFVTDTTTYSFLRFMAGFGLAGELGAAITLIAELMTKEKRGIGTVIIVAMGSLGAVASAAISKNYSWQTAYFVGGGLGLVLLLLRFGTFESGMFQNLKNTEGVTKGDFLSLFRSKERFVKYFWCILLGTPIWFTTGVIVKFSPKIGEITGVSGTISVADAIMFAYIGLSFGDLVCGWLSQVYQNRRIVVAVSLAFSVVLSIVILYGHGMSLRTYYVACFFLGAGSGYWGLFVTIASEQFGTNLRATVTTTVPNFVRGSAILITLSYKSLEATSGAIEGATWVGIVSFGLAFVAIWQLKETFGKDLNYYEM
jgi:MFS transporter, putative metabolite:H+ symporter